MREPVFRRLGRTHHRGIRPRLNESVLDEATFRAVNDPAPLILRADGVCLLRARCTWVGSATHVADAIIIDAHVAIPHTALAALPVAPLGAATWADQILSVSLSRCGAEYSSGMTSPSESRRKCSPLWTVRKDREAASKVKPL